MDKVDTIVISDEIKEEIRKFHAIYDEILRPRTAQEAAKDGIHPVIINGDIVGIRLGEEKAKDSGSLALIGGDHHYEVAYLNSFKHVLDWWKTQSPQSRKSMDGDVYLIFGGQKERMAEVWDLLENNTTITPAQLIAARVTKVTDAMPVPVNMNRVPKTEANITNPSERWLYNRYQKLNQEVFSKSKLTMAVHSMTQPIEGVAISEYFGWPDAKRDKAAFDRRLGIVKQRLSKLVHDVGAAHLINGLANDVPTQDLIGPASLEQGNERLFFECGGPDLSMGVFNNGKRAAQAALHYVFPAHAAAPERSGHEVTMYSDSDLLFAPGLLDVDGPPQVLGPKQACAKKFLPQDLPAGAWGDTLYLLTGYNNDSLPQEVKDKLKDMSATIPEGQLGNGQLVKKGQPVGWTKKGDEHVILTMPDDGTVFMSPRVGQYPNTDSTYVFCYSRQREKLVHPELQPKAGAWASR